MDCLAAIKTRFSCRKFEKGTMSQEDERAIIEAGMSAPSAMNRRPYDIIAIHDQSIYASLESEKPTLSLFKENPLSLLIVVDLGKNDKMEFYEQDASAVAENMLLAATALGYGSLWAGITEGSAFQVGLSKILGIPEGHKPVIFLSFGKKLEHKEVRASRYEEGKLHLERW